LKLLVDECCRRSLVEALRSAGHDVLWAAETASGTRDAALLTRAVAEHRVLITEDKDFGELALHLDGPIAGVVLLRFVQRDPVVAAERLIRLLAGFPGAVEGKLVVLTDKRTRFRPLRGRD
jgi:predicted nuclease of predicted toxin-antitoxin system